MNERILTDTDRDTCGFSDHVRLALKLYGFRKSLLLYLLLKLEEREFVASAEGQSERVFRRQMLSRFRKIHSRIPCAHTPFQFVLVANFIFGLEVEGPIVECGAFKGGSSAQLSLIAERTNRKLYVCDSFCGLPQPVSAEEATSPIFNSRCSFTFKQGEYWGSLDEVKANIAECGNIAVCELVPGFFAETLPSLHVKPAVIVIDVDYVSSARDCLRYLWPRLRQNGLFFTHEANLEEYITGIMDIHWWNVTLGECPPLIFGAGSGLSPLAPGIALLIKKQGLSPSSPHSRAPL